MKKVLLLNGIQIAGSDGFMLEWGRVPVAWMFLYFMLPAAGKQVVAWDAGC